MSALEARLYEGGALRHPGRPAPRRAPQQLYRPPGQRHRPSPPSQHQQQQQEPAADRRPPRQLYVPPRGRRAGFNRASSPGFSTCSEIVTSWRAQPEVLRARPPPGPRRRISQQTRQHVQVIAEANWRQEEGGSVSRPQSRLDCGAELEAGLHSQKCELSDSRQSLDSSTPEASPNKRPARRRRRGRRARSRSRDVSADAADTTPSFQLLTFPLPPTATASRPSHVPWRSNSVTSLYRASSVEPELLCRNTPARPASATPLQHCQQPRSAPPPPRAPRPQGVYQPPAARRLAHTVAAPPPGRTAEGHGRPPARHGHGHGHSSGESGRTPACRSSRSGESSEESEERLRGDCGGYTRLAGGEGGAGSESERPHTRPASLQGKGGRIDGRVLCGVAVWQQADSQRQPRPRRISSGSSSEACSPQKQNGDDTRPLAWLDVRHLDRSANTSSSEALSPLNSPKSAPLSLQRPDKAGNPGHSGKLSPSSNTEPLLDDQRAALTQKTGVRLAGRVTAEVANRPPSTVSRSTLPQLSPDGDWPLQNGAADDGVCLTSRGDVSLPSCSEDTSTCGEVTPLESDAEVSVWFGPYTDDQKASMGLKELVPAPADGVSVREGSLCDGSSEYSVVASGECLKRTERAGACAPRELQSPVTETSVVAHNDGIGTCVGELNNLTLTCGSASISPTSSSETNTAPSHDSDTSVETPNPPPPEYSAGALEPGSSEDTSVSPQPAAKLSPPANATTAEPLGQSSSSLSVDDDGDDGGPFSWADEVDEWERQYTEDGELPAQVPLSETVLETPRKPIIDYLAWRPESPDSDGAGSEDVSLPGHVIEVYDFPASFTTQDLGVIYQEYSGSGFSVKWVDDTHALAVFSSPSCAHEALQKRHPLVRGRPLARASPQSRQKAARCLPSLQPYRARPETCALRARRMVATALGLRAQVSPEKRDRERRQLQQAKDKKRLAAKQKEDAWEGKF